jgi:hypothetical protein
MRAAFAVVLTVAFGSAADAWGAQSLIDGEHARLALGGYALTLGGVQLLRFALGPGAPAEPLPDHLGLQASVLRLEWKADIGEHVAVEVHQRGFLRTSSEALSGMKLGLGASTAPRRTVDLRSVGYNDERLLLEHDIDRASVHVSFGDVDIMAGRQAITWGFASLFRVADLWTTFSPFELDTSQKRGVDALRVLYSHSRRLELEGVVSDRGTLRDLSAGLRAVTSFASVDAYLAFTKQWRELIALAGAGAVLGSFKLHAEAAAPYDLDAGELSRPRGSIGMEWFHGDLTLTLEGHYNGSGVAHAEDYGAHLLTSPIVARGESYFLGRWYTGAAVGWRISELLQVALTALGNLQDPSALLAASLTYAISQETALSLGAYQGLGEKLVIAAVPELHSEFGAAGGLYYLSLSAYF